MEIKILLTKDEYKDVVSYCELNKFNMDNIIKKSFLEGFRIEKYGLLNSKSEIIKREVIKEIIKEVPVEKIVEVPIDRVFEKIVEVVKEVPVEVIKEVQVPSPPIEIEVIKYVDREVVKEVFIEKPVVSFDNDYEKKYIDELENKIKILESKPVEIREVVKEVPVEIIKEVVIEKSDELLRGRMTALQTTLQNLRQENNEKDNKLKECEKMVDELKKFNSDTGAVYLNRSNLDDKLYK
jgi:chaperonin cofactor prefoldin